MTMKELRSKYKGMLIANPEKWEEWHEIEYVDDSDVNEYGEGKTYYISYRVPVTELGFIADVKVDSVIEYYGEDAKGSYSRQRRVTGGFLNHVDYDLQWEITEEKPAASYTARFRAVIGPDVADNDPFFTYEFTLEECKKIEFALCANMPLFAAPGLKKLYAKLMKEAIPLIEDELYRCGVDPEYVDPENYFVKFSGWILDKE